MGQLLNRFIRVVKSNFDTASQTYPSVSASEADELKRIIDELNSEKKDKQTEQRRTTSEKHNAQAKVENDSPKSLDMASACAILGVSPNADIEAIKAAYKTRIKEYHPDRTATLGEDIRQLAAKKTLEINRAYEFVKKMKNF